MNEAKFGDFWKNFWKGFERSPRQHRGGHIDVQEIRGATPRDLRRHDTTTIGTGGVHYKCTAYQVIN